MNFREDSDIFLSQLLSGMLLFQREVSDKELLGVIEMIFNILGCDVYDDEYYNELFEYLDNNGICFKIKEKYDYNSILEVNGKKITLYNYLLSKTNEMIINFLKTNVYYNQFECKRIVKDDEISFLSYINNFFKERILSEKKQTIKKKIRTKHETKLV